MMRPHDIPTLGSWTNSSNDVVQHVQQRDVLDDIYSDNNQPPYGNKVGRHSYRKITWKQYPGFHRIKRFEIVGNVLIGEWYDHGIYDSPLGMQYSLPEESAAGDTDTDAYNKALSRFNEKVRGSTDLSVDLGQSRQTMQILSQAKKLVQSVLSLKNPKSLIQMVLNEGSRRPAKTSNLKKLKNLREERRLAEVGLIQYAKIPASAWLAWVYGVKPTLQTIYDVVHHQAVHYNNEFKLFDSSGSARYEGSDLNPSWNAWPDGQFDHEVNLTYESRCKIGAVLRIPDNTLTEVARLSSLNPASIAWELMPFSFVVDWVVDIGGYLRDLETALTYNSYFVRGYVTRLTIAKAEVICRKNIVEYLPPFRIETSGSADLRVSSVRMSRTPLSSYPYPRPPVINAKMGSGRLLNAAALLGTFLGRGSKRPGSDYQRAVRGEF